MSLGIFSLLIIAVGIPYAYFKYNRYLPTFDQSKATTLSQLEIEKIRAQTPITLIRVFKAKRTLELLHDDQVIKAYSMRLGFDPIGHKVKEGDGKTPEGRYTIDWRNGKSEFYKSLHVSYPNKKDVLRAEQLGVLPGGNIMIHGSGSNHEHDTQADLMEYLPKKDWTTGCIAVRNIDMDEVWSLVDDGTVIEIYP